MATWLRRLIYFVLVLLWLLVMSFPVIAVVLAAQGQIEVGSAASGSHVRLFLVQESDREGVGLEWTRPARRTGCREGRISYLMWEGSGENARYCTCVNASGAVVSSQPGACSVD